MDTFYARMPRLTARSSDAKVGGMVRLEESVALLNGIAGEEIAASNPGVFEEFIMPTYLEGEHDLLASQLVNVLQLQMALRDEFARWPRHVFDAFWFTGKEEREKIRDFVTDIRLEYEEVFRAAAQVGPNARESENIVEPFVRAIIEGMIIQQRIAEERWRVQA